MQFFLKFNWYVSLCPGDIFAANIMLHESVIEWWGFFLLLFKFIKSVYPRLHLGPVEYASPKER